MSLTEDDLLPTEEVLVTKFANLWVKPSRHGLSRFAFDKYLGDDEAIGGKAFLTNYRIVFKSHGLNRLTGKHSLLLPNVVDIRKGLFGITVESRAQSFEFVMWFNGRFVRAALARRAEMGAEEVARLRELLTRHPDRMGEGLRKCGAAERVNRVLSGFVSVGEVMTGLGPADRGAFAELLALCAAEG